MTDQSSVADVRDRHYARRNVAQVFKPGQAVYSKRCGTVAGFDGIIVEARGSGFQVLSSADGKTYQRDHYDLIATSGEGER